MIVSCGDSFFYGSDLQDRTKTWPALIANELGHDHVCCASPGVGNLQILQQTISAYQKFGNNAVYMINWTWIDRFDYVSIEDDTWHTVRPSLDDSTRDPTYYKYFHSELADKFTNLVYISQALAVLSKAKYFMTYMDQLLLDRRWHAPDYIRYLQNTVRPHLNDFDGKTFLEWSRAQGYAESAGWHPLEQAHASAAAWWLPTIQSL